MPFPHFHHPAIAMPSTSPQHQHIVVIDKELAATIVSLPMMVPNSWWERYRRNEDTLNTGTIVGVNFDQPYSNYFQLECGSKIYAMRHNAVH